MQRPSFHKNTGIVQILDDTVSKFPEREALVFKNWRLTYKELYSLINKTARYLMSLGIKKGDHISFVAKNCTEFVVFELAALKIGAVVVRVNWRMNAEELKYVFDLNEVTHVFLRGVRTKYRDELRSHYGDEICFIDFRECDDGSAIYELVGEFSDENFTAQISGEDTSMHLHTSGTTGKPKCVVYTHATVLSIVSAIHAKSDLENWHRSQFLAQLFHTASIGVYVSLAAGETTFLLDHFEPQEFMKMIIDEKITTLVGTPTVIKWVLDEKDRNNYDLPYIKRIVYATFPMPLALLERAMEAFDCEFHQGYGMTEMCSSVTELSPEDHFLDNGAYLGSVGKALALNEIKAIREDGSTCEPNEVGEICVKGPNRMKCYYKEPELTEKVFIDGWYRTKDMGYISDKGYVYICGRTDDLIITGGENVYPNEIMNVIMLMSTDITEAAVYGIEDPTWGEKIKVSLTLVPSSEITIEDIDKHCRANLPKYKVPRIIEIVDVLPKNAVGKVDIKELKRRHW